jgi:hypothetical protein
MSKILGRFIREKQKPFDSGSSTVIKSGKTGETQEALQLQGTHSASFDVHFAHCTSPI